MDDLIGQENQFVSVILIAIGLLILMTIAVVLFFYFSRRRVIKAELEKANLEIDHQKELLQSTIITQEEERKRIAQDLHDAISSKLNVVSLNANILSETDISSAEANKIGESIYKVTSTVLENSRRIAHDLLPPTLQKFGLQAALEELCEELVDTKKFNLTYKIDYPLQFLEPNAELHIFRIVQELMNNSIKHSEANDLNLSVITEENLLSLQYQDNGKGFQMDAMRAAKGLGMSGIEHRAIILEADLTIESSPGNGILINLKTKPKNAN
ncbi:MAG: histidine kinase [Bacteroidota bacterium]